MIPALFRELFDDAAIFPPGDLPLPEAVPAHRAHRAAWYADTVGPFLCGPARLGELRKELDGPLAVGLVLPGGCDQLLPALREAEGLDLVTVEIAAPNVREAVAFLDEYLPEGVTGAVELPRGGGLEKALDALAETPYRAKYRTGGLSADAFPSVEELAGFLACCVERGVPYKCTAGLHNAVRHTDPVTGFEHHGFLNVLLASLAGDREVAADVLAERNGAVLAGAINELMAHQVEYIRRFFTSFGTCSIAEPLEDLAQLDLLTSNLENR